MTFRPSRLVAALGLALALRDSLRAQTFPTDDPVIRRIYAWGWTARAGDRGPRALRLPGAASHGLPGPEAGRGLAGDRYKSWGIDAREEQFGTWRGWVRGHSHIDLVAPRNRTLEGQMVGYSPGTGGKDVVLETVVLPRFRDSTEFVKWLPQAKGKLVMISAALPTCRPQDDWAANAHTGVQGAHGLGHGGDAARDWASVRRPGPDQDGASAGAAGHGLLRGARWR